MGGWEATRREAGQLSPVGDFSQAFNSSHLDADWEWEPSCVKGTAPATILLILCLHFFVEV